MYRWPNNRARTLRVQRRYKRAHGYQGVYPKGRVLYEDQLGRFRKNSGVGCPFGRGCNYCSRDVKDQHELRADVDFAEQVDRDTIKSRVLVDVRPGGLGVHFIHQVMDVVEYKDRDDEPGNMLEMRKTIGDIKACSIKCKEDI